MPKFNKENNNETLKNNKTETTESISDTQNNLTNDITSNNVEKKQVNIINDDDEDLQKLCIVDEDDSIPKSPINSISSPIRNTNLSSSSSQNNVWEVKNIPLETVSSTSPTQNINNYLEKNIEINQVISGNLITSTSSNLSSSSQLLNKVDSLTRDSTIKEDKFITCDKNIDNNAIVDSTTNIEKTANQIQQNDTIFEQSNSKYIKNTICKDDQPSTSNKNALKFKPHTKFLPSSSFMIEKLSPPGLVKNLNLFSTNEGFNDATKQSNAYNSKINYFSKPSTGFLGSAYSELHQSNSQRLGSSNLIDNSSASNLWREKELNNDTKTSSTESHNSFQRLANSINKVENKNKALETNIFQNNTQLNNSLNLSDKKNKQKIMHQVRSSKQIFDNEPPPVFFNLPQSTFYNNNNGNKATNSSNLSKKAAPLTNYSLAKFTPSSSSPVEHFNNNLNLLNQSTSAAGSLENTSRQNSSINWTNNKSFLSKNEIKKDAEFFNIFDVLINNINQSGHNPIVVIIPDPDLILDFSL